MATFRSDKQALLVQERRVLEHTIFGAIRIGDVCRKRLNQALRDLDVVTVMWAHNVVTGLVDSVGQGT